MELRRSKLVTEAVMATTTTTTTQTIYNNGHVKRKATYSNGVASEATNGTCNYEAHKSRWMNPRAKSGCAYQPTIFEHYANVLTHGTLVVPSIIGAIYMISFCKTHAQYRSSLIYGMGLVLLFTISTLFHLFSLLHHFKFKQFFHYCDRATIYLFIASSYTPWLYLRSTHTLLGEYMISIIWICAFLGVMYQLMFHEKYKILEVIFYLAIGLCPSIVVIDMVDVSGLTELAAGGVLYVIGLIFFKCDGIIPFAHAIWHLFVCTGAMTHYYAILKYLIDK